VYQVFSSSSASFSLSVTRCTLDELNQKFLIRDMFRRLAMLHVDTTGVSLSTGTRPSERQVDDLVTMISHDHQDRLLRQLPHQSGCLSSSITFWPRGLSIPADNSVRCVQP